MGKVPSVQAGLVWTEMWGLGASSEGQGWDCPWAARGPCSVHWGVLGRMGSLVFVRSAGNGLVPRSTGHLGLVQLFKIQNKRSTHCQVGRWMYFKVINCWLIAMQVTVLDNRTPGYVCCYDVFVSGLTILGQLHSFCLVYKSQRGAHQFFKAWAGTGSVKELNWMKIMELGSLIKITADIKC